MDGQKPRTEASAEPRPKGSRKWKTWLLLALILIGGLAFWLRPEKPALVAVERVQSAPTSLILALNGRISPRHEVAVRSEVSGRVTSVLVEEGAKVAKGDILAELDTAIITARIAEARAALQVQELRQKQASLTAERAQALERTSLARASVEEAELTRLGAERDSERLQAALQQVEREAESYTIRAERDGVILARSVEAGQVITSADDLFTLGDLSELRVTTEVDELYAARIQTGQKATLRAVGHSMLAEGRVDMVAPRVDESSGGREIKITFPGAEGMPVGLTVNANLYVEDIPQALTLPRQALIRDTDGTRVTLLEGGKAVPREVRILDWPAERVVVLEGLTEGDTVILDPEGIEPGARLEARP